MNSYTINAKGQIALSDDLLRHLGVQPGAKLSIEKLSNGRIEITAARPAGQISDCFGILKSKREGPALSIDEMNKIISEGWAGKR